MKNNFIGSYFIEFSLRSFFETEILLVYEYKKMVAIIYKTLLSLPPPLSLFQSHLLHCSLDRACCSGRREVPVYAVTTIYFLTLVFII